eukprot:g4579.t1
MCLPAGEQSDGSTVSEITDWIFSRVAVPFFSTLEDQFAPGFDTVRRRGVEKIGLALVGLQATMSKHIYSGRRLRELPVEELEKVEEYYLAVLDKLKAEERRRMTKDLSDFSNQSNIANKAAGLGRSVLSSVSDYVGSPLNWFSGRNDSLEGAKNSGSDNDSGDGEELVYVTSPRKGSKTQLRRRRRKKLRETIGVFRRQGEDFSK